METGKNNQAKELLLKANAGLGKVAVSDYSAPFRPLELLADVQRTEAMLRQELVDQGAVDRQMQHSLGEAYKLYKEFYQRICEKSVGVVAARDGNEAARDYAHAIGVKIQKKNF
ncbi:MAG: hypothetical protein ACOYK8_09390 [Alphaproteobacteria bacterium]